MTEQDHPINPPNGAPTAERIREESRSQWETAKRLRSILESPSGSSGIPNLPLRCLSWARGLWPSESNAPGREKRRANSPEPGEPIPL